MPEVEGDDEITMEVTCPKCGHTWEETQTVTVTVSFDWGDFAPDYSWRD